MKRSIRICKHRHERDAIEESDLNEMLDCPLLELHNVISFPNMNHSTLPMERYQHITCLARLIVIAFIQVTLSVMFDSAK